MPPVKMTEKVQKKIHIGYITRCYVCGCRLTTVDDYGKLDSDDRWYDPDWVIQRHVRRTH